MARLTIAVGSLVLGFLFLIPSVPVLGQEEAPAVKCDPFINGAASLLIPGWGQWLNGEKEKAVMHLVVGLGLSVGAVLLYPTNLALLLGAARSVWSLYSVYDAFTTCLQKHKEAEQVGGYVPLLAYSGSGSLAP